MSLKNKVALVTGGTSGIGLATAKELLHQQAKVIITGRRADVLAETAAEIGAIAMQTDHSNIADIDTLSSRIRSGFGGIDILFINAGITGSPALIENSTTSNFDEVMNINFRGAYFTLSKLIPLLKDGASVIFLSSNTSTMHSPQHSIYQASKAALNSIAKTAAVELASRGIRVNIISPGPTRTNVLNQAYGQIAANEIWDQLAYSSPLKKVGDPADIGKIVSYLSGESSSYITGAELLMDGGMSL